MHPVSDDNKFVIDLKEKAEILNASFAKQCSLLKNNIKLSKNLLCKICNVQISKDAIIKIINNIDPNKAHRHDMIIIGILKLCCPSLCNPFSIRLNSSSVKWSYSARHLRSQGKNSLSFPYTLF